MALLLEQHLRSLMHCTLILMWKLQLFLMESMEVWIRCHIINSHRNAGSRGVILMLVIKTSNYFSYSSMQNTTSLSVVAFFGTFSYLTSKFFLKDLLRRKFRWIIIDCSVGWRWVLLWHLIPKHYTALLVEKSSLGKCVHLLHITITVDCQ